MSLSKAHLFQEYSDLLISRKKMLHPDMTEKLLTGTLNLNANKQTNTFSLVEIVLSRMGQICYATGCDR